jgi:hypothetical protein
MQIRTVAADARSCIPTQTSSKNEIVLRMVKVTLLTVDLFSVKKKSSFPFAYAVALGEGKTTQQSLSLCIFH